MIEKQTILDQIEITRDGTLRARFGLLLIEDGVEIDCKWHRTTFPPGHDIDVQMAAVNNHLTQLGKNTVPSEDIDRIKAQAAVAWTEEVINAYQQELNNV